MNSMQEYLVENIRLYRLLRLQMRESLMRMNYIFFIKLRDKLKNEYSSFISDFDLNRLLSVLPIDSLNNIYSININSLLNQPINSILCVEGQIHYIAEQKKHQLKNVDQRLIEKKSIMGDVIYGTGMITGVVSTCYNDRLVYSGDDIIYVTKSLHPKDLLASKHFRAVLVDEGGILSHASIIAREMKIPCIMNTKCLSLLLNDGDIVSINFDTGEISREENPVKRYSESNHFQRLSPELTDANRYGNKCVNLCRYISKFLVADGYAIDWEYVEYLYMCWKYNGRIGLSREEREIVLSLCPAILRSSSSYEDNDNYTGAVILESLANVNSIDEFIEALAVVYESSKTLAVENYGMLTSGSKNGHVSILMQRYFDFNVVGTALLEERGLTIEYQHSSNKELDIPSVFKLSYTGMENNSNTRLEELPYELIVELEKFYPIHQSVLIEFGLINNMVYLLQIRKVGKQ